MVGKVPLQAYQHRRPVVLRGKECALPLVLLNLAEGDLLKIKAPASHVKMQVPFGQRS